MAGTPQLGAPGQFDDPGDVPGVRFEPWRFGDGPERNAMVRIDADHVHVARARLGGAGVWSEGPDGSATVELVVTDAEAFRDLVLEFLDHAEVVSPPDLRSMVIEWVGAMA
jgi:predicted DNA-binding transcriptional regulator YafY